MEIQFQLRCYWIQVVVERGLVSFFYWCDLLYMDYILGQVFILRIVGGFKLDSMGKDRRGEKENNKLVVQRDSNRSGYGEVGIRMDMIKIYCMKFVKKC